MPVGEADADEGDEVEDPRHAQQGVEPALVLAKHVFRFFVKIKVHRFLAVVDLSSVGRLLFFTTNSLQASRRELIQQRYVGKNKRFFSVC